MTRSAETIRKDMQHLRCEIADDMKDVRESARQMTDWRSYVQRYPLVSVGVAAAAGYLLIPNRAGAISPDVDTLLKLAKRNRLVVQDDVKSQAKTGLAATLLTLAGGAAVRAGVALAGQYLGKYVNELSHPPENA
ncbi:MAG: hypothetical protein ABI614_11815 [Planctomycetota bacterium]